MRAAAAHLWGGPSPARPRVGVAGVGKVGRTWSTSCSRTAPTSCDDVNAAAVERRRGRAPRGRVGRRRRRAGQQRRRRLRARAPSAAPSTTPPWSSSRRASSAEGRTTSSPTPESAERPGDRGVALRPGLPGERRRRDPGGGRAPRLLVRARQGEGSGHLRATLGVLTEAAERGISPAAAADAARRAAHPRGRQRPPLAPGAARLSRSCSVRAADSGRAMTPMCRNTRRRCTVGVTRESHSGAPPRAPAPVRRMRGSTPWGAAVKRPSRPRSPGS